MHHHRLAIHGHHHGVDANRFFLALAAVLRHQADNALVVVNLGDQVDEDAAALRTEIMERDNLMEHAQVTGAYFQEKLRGLADLPMVGDVRGVGLMGCVEAVSSKKTKKAFDGALEVGKRIDKKCQEKGLILRPMWHLCVFSPPIIITKNQVDDMVGIMEGAIKSVADDLVREGAWDGKD